MTELFPFDGDDLVKKINCLLHYSSFLVGQNDVFEISVDWRNTSSAKQNILLCWTFAPSEAELDKEEGIIFESRTYLLHQLRDFLYPEFMLTNVTISSDMATVEATIKNYVKSICNKPPPQLIS